MKLGAAGPGESQLLFALLFMSTQAFSKKRTISNFRCMSGGGTFNRNNLQGGAIYAINDVQITISDTKFESNSADYKVSEISTAF